MYESWIAIAIGFLAALLSWLPGVGPLLAGASLWLSIRAVRNGRTPLAMAALSLALVAAAVTLLVHAFIAWRYFSL